MESIEVNFLMVNVMEMDSFNGLTDNITLGNGEMVIGMGKEYGLISKEIAIMVHGLKGKVKDMDISLWMVSIY